MIADSGKHGRQKGGAFPPWPFKMGQWGRRCIFHNSITK